MTYGDFKISIEALLLGDKKLPENKYVLSFLKQGLERVASDCSPLSLVSEDIEDDIFIYLNGSGQFIRVPNLPVSDGDLIDLDNSLLGALSNLVASYISTRPEVYQKCMINADKALMDYKWNMYRILEEMQDDESSKYGCALKRS